jgi:hypothetical protein
VESLTSLEYTKGNWSVYKYDPNNYQQDLDDDDKTDAEDLDAKLDVNTLLERFKQDT